MSTEAMGSAPETEQPAAAIVELMLSPYDELAEIDMVHDRVRLLRHSEGKHFSPAISGGFLNMFRYTAENLVHPDDMEVFLAECHPNEILRRLETSETGVLRHRFRYKTAGGDWHLVEQTAVGGAVNGLPEGVYYAFLTDIQDEAKPEAEDAEDAAELAEPPSAAANVNLTPFMRNALTGLLWEEHFYSLAGSFIKEHSEGWCMAAIDLEHFKLFNEWYGRDQGDLLLASVGAKIARLEQSVGGLACYLGQDDFCILMPFDMELIEKLYEDIHELVKSYGTSVGFMPAIGVSLMGAEGESSVYDVYDRAALAAHRAKDDYHNRIRLFELSMMMQTDRDYHILSDFQKALTDHELFIMLQPQCEIASGKVVGAESLVRWRKLNGEMVSPGVFVPVLERYGFVTDLDKYVWEEVCAWQKRWIDSGSTAIPVSVNVSQIDIFTIDVPAYFDSLMEKYELPSDSIKIEITESAYVDNKSVADTVQRLRARGLTVLMDDFGSGYSSLNMLRNLNVDIIKLDAQFLRMSGDDRKGLQIMESIVNMAKTMAVPIIVEGVETKEESDFLSDLGCRYVQGYYFYRPMPVADFESLIADPANIDNRGFRVKAREQFHIREFLDQNLFSDTMLNDILGPVAFYDRVGDNIDIVRYNQQLTQEIKVANLTGRLKSVQNAVAEEDRKLLFELLDWAEMDTLHGAEGMVHIRRDDGSAEALRVHFFFLKREGEKSHFYGSVYNLTEFSALNDQMRLLSSITRDSVVFARHNGETWIHRVVEHGLEGAMGLSGRQLQRELDNGSFFERVEESERERLIRQIHAAAERPEGFTAPFRMDGADGRTLTLRAKVDFVHDDASGVEYIMTLRSA